MSYESCGHEPCHCSVEGKEYCSQYCEQHSAPGLSVVGDYECGCGHAACADEEE